MLFFFDGEVGSQFPRIMFCGFGNLAEEYPGLMNSCSGRFYEVIESFGQCLLSHITSVPSDPVSKICYSEPLIVWLSILAGRDGGPKRYLDLENVVQMLWEKIESFQSSDPNGTGNEWLYDYFGAGRLNLDTTFTYPTRITFGPSEAAELIKIHLKEKDIKPGVHYNFIFFPPDLDRAVGLKQTVRTMSAYLASHLEHQGVDPAIIVKTWPLQYRPTVNNLEAMIQALSDIMYDSLERSIKMSTWGAEYMEYVGGTMGEIPITRAIYDRSEPTILARLIETVHYLQESLLDELHRVLTEAQADGPCNEDGPHGKAMKDIQVLLLEAKTRYRQACLVVFDETEQWVIKKREARNSIAVKNSLMKLEKWFDVQLKGTEMAVHFANDKDLTFARGVDKYLRLELSVSLDKPMEELVESRIVSSTTTRSSVFPDQRFGFEYRIPDWKETSVERENRISRQDRMTVANWEAHIQAVRNGAVEWIEWRARSPRRQTPSPEEVSPGLKVGGSRSHAHALEAEYRKIRGRRREPARRRSLIFKNEYRVFKMIKNWKKHYCFGYWYTDASLLENFRQIFKRQSLPFEESKVLFNKKAHGTTALTLGDDIQTTAQAIKAIESAMRAFGPLYAFKEMSLCSSASDHSLPVEERPETWDVSSSEGEEDLEGKWISKREQRVK